jgi:hypothetical protein
MRPNPLQPPTMNYLVFLCRLALLYSTTFFLFAQQSNGVSAIEYFSAFLISLWANSFSVGVQFHRGCFNHSAMAFLHLSGVFLFSVGVFTFCRGAVGVFTFCRGRFYFLLVYLHSVGGVFIVFTFCRGRCIYILWALYVTVGVYF